MGVLSMPISQGCLKSSTCAAFSDEQGAKTFPPKWEFADFPWRRRGEGERRIKVKGGLPPLQPTQVSSSYNSNPPSPSTHSQMRLRGMSASSQTWEDNKKTQGKTRRLSTPGAPTYTRLLPHPSLEDCEAPSLSLTLQYRSGLRRCMNGELRKSPPPPPRVPARVWRRIRGIFSGGQKAQPHPQLRKCEEASFFPWWGNIAASHRE